MDASALPDSVVCSYSATGVGADAWISGAATKARMASAGSRCAAAARRALNEQLFVQALQRRQAMRQAGPLVAGRGADRSLASRWRRRRCAHAHPAAFDAGRIYLISMHVKCHPFFSKGRFLARKGRHGSRGGCDLARGLYGPSIPSSQYQWPASEWAKICDI